MAKLIWSPKSIQRLEEIFEYIAQDSMDDARIFVGDFIKIVNTIPDFPKMGRSVPEFEDVCVRERMYKNYRVVYRIQNDIIEIVTIVHSRQLLNKDNL